MERHRWKFALLPALLVPAALALLLGACTLAANVAPLPKAGAPRTVILTAFGGG